MFVFPWRAVSSLGTCKARSYIIHVWLVQSHSSTNGQNKEDRKVTASSGRYMTHAPESLGERAVFTMHRPFH